MIFFWYYENYKEMTDYVNRLSEIKNFISTDIVLNKS